MGIERHCIISTERQLLDLDYALVRIFNCSKDVDDGVAYIDICSAVVLNLFEEPVSVQNC